jgi:hypothetical protein
MNNTIRKLNKREYQRKLMQRMQHFGTISVPIDVMERWSNYESVCMHYDFDLDVLLITPTGKMNHDDD